MKPYSHMLVSLQLLYVATMHTVPYAFSSTFSHSKEHLAQRLSAENQSSVPFDASLSFGIGEISDALLPPPVGNEG